MSVSEAVTRPRLLTLRSGGWVLVLAALLTGGILVWALAGAFLRSGGPLLGDGRTVESYGFDLSTCLVDRELLVAAGMRKDALRALVDPAVIPGADVARINAEERGKYLVSTDRVIGVSVNGEHRAYPLLILNVHEIVNDTLGGVAVAITYNPPCDAVAVFERTLDGVPLEFGVSGLLYNSNLLMYDRRPDGLGESLWSQLQARAIAGPAAGRGARLVPRPAALISWSQWLALHPETTVLSRDPRLARRYKETSYAVYFRSSDIKFPVRPQPPADGPPAKERLIAVATSQGVRAYTHATIAQRAGASGSFGDRFGDAQLTFHWRQEPGTVRVSSDPPEAIQSVMHAFWFAWHAMHPDDEPQ